MILSHGLQLLVYANRRFFFLIVQVGELLQLLLVLRVLFLPLLQLLAGWFWIDVVLLELVLSCRMPGLLFFQLPYFVLMLHAVPSHL